ncbi:MAG: hypothetical protein OXH04_00680 [Acidobacteria bacterium]|nr:hypothetical protein [Acidobacteriota bacterium]
MLQVARLSPTLLGDAADLTADFLAARLNPDGGFQDRDGASDLYYTVFGLEALTALRRELPAAEVRGFLERHDDPTGLDFVHTACLARCWADIGAAEEAPAAALVGHLETWRTPDGGYSQTAGADHGTAYGCFLALGAYEDLGVALPAPDRLLDSLTGLRAADGGYGNRPGSPTGLTPPTAAAVTVQRRLDRPAEPDAVAWLRARHLPEGGFRASAAAPIPDLLSTATALHALAGAHAPLEPLREPCLDFVDSLWTNSGGFYGSWGDDVQDCEYTFYALLALGHLSL